MDCGDDFSDEFTFEELNAIDRMEQTFIKEISTDAKHTENFNIQTVMEIERRSKYRYWQ